jgi:uncharacterized membrane protein
MRARTVVLAVLAAALSVTAVASPATAAKRNELQQAGSGTWVRDGVETIVSGTATGQPFSGHTEIRFQPDSGELPPWPGCGAASGSLTLTSDTDRLVLRFRGGEVCLAVPPTADVVFQAWYDVVEYTGTKGKKAPSGSGSIDVRTMKDGTVTWMVSGSLR